MKAVLLDEFGPPEVMRIGEIDRPRPGPDQVLVRVAATSVNRPDIIQRLGRYPPPEGESPVLGLEVAGTVEALGDNAEGFMAGDRVFGLVGGGAYAEFAAVYASHLLRIPERLSFEQAACICEAYITAYMNLFMGARLQPGESVLLHGGGGGVNTAGIQIVRVLRPEGQIFVTASPGKVDRVKALGVDLVVDYRACDFAEVVLDHTNQRGVDVILDHIGADYFARNMRALAVNGRLAVIATMSGREATLDLARLMVKRQTVMGSVLRPRPIAEKARIIAEFSRDVLPHFGSGAIEPVIDRICPIEDVVEAHRAMEAGEHFGKIVLTMN